MHKTNKIAKVLIFTLALSACQQKPSLFNPVSPENALSTFEIADGFKLELVAAEPLVKSPVDMEIDEFGRMYVVEMPGYPLDVEGSGKIILLSDTDGVEMGRIYRISPVNGKKADWTKGLNLGNADINTLIKELSNTNG